MTEPEEPDSVEWMRQRWLKQDEPKPEHFAAMAALLRTTILVTGEMDRVLKECQLSRTGYLILITLQASRDQTRPLGQLSKALLVHPTTVTVAVDQLEKPGLVRRVPHPTDRRTILARLTPAGDDMAERATKALAGIGYGLGDVPAASATQVTAALRRIRQALGDLARYR
jgi:DNA-binding MarR family transcriptional regulator